MIKSTGSPWIDLHYSDHDDLETGKGWYFSNSEGLYVTSQSFSTETEARLAYKNSLINWGE